MPFKQRLAQRKFERTRYIPLKEKLIVQTLEGP